MNERKETVAKLAAMDTEQTRKMGTMVYCGPSVRGVARQYNVYHEALPAPLKKFIKDHPAAKGLVVPLERFPETRRRLDSADSAESILFSKVKKEL